MNSANVLVDLPGAYLHCCIDYTVTDRVGGVYGCGKTVIDLISIKTHGGINVLAKVSNDEQRILKMGLYEREARKLFESQPKKEGTEKC